MCMWPAGCVVRLGQAENVVSGRVKAGEFSKKAFSKYSSSLIIGEVAWMFPARLHVHVVVI